MLVSQRRTSSKKRVSPRQKFDLKVWKKILSFMAPAQEMGVPLDRRDVRSSPRPTSVFPLLDDLRHRRRSSPAILDLNRRHADGNPSASSASIIAFMVVQATMVYLFIVLARRRCRPNSPTAIRKNAFRHLQELPFSYYDQTQHRLDHGPHDRRLARTSPTSSPGASSTSPGASS
ncbi:MAG: hypothetical protein MZU97_13010 [Bacillus subtilis]|nr:hypothetical protein [Bacillus subtilis]